MQPTNTKRCKVKRSTKWFSQIFKMVAFRPKKKQNFNLSNIMPKKSKILYISKNRIHVIELCVTKSFTKFEQNNFIFGCEMVPKPIDGNDVIF